MKKVLHSAQPSVEVLEARIAPAAVYTFTDIDGDQVTITTSKGTVDDIKAAAHFEGPLTGQILQELDLASNPVFKGANISITVEGAGTVNVGYINATGMDLGRVFVDGDLGQIDAGDTKLSTPAIKRLEVGSLGAEGTTTQAPTNPSLISTLTGPLPTFISGGDVKGTLSVGGTKLSAGRIDSIEIGGSLIGGADPSSGSIIATGTIGKVVIGENLEGGGAANTGFIDAALVKSISIGNNIIGGGGEFSGAIRSDGFVKTVNVAGSITGGAGINSGTIVSGGGLGNVTIDGGIVGGDGFESGTIGTRGTINKVTIGTEVTGGVGPRSGSVLATARVEEVIVNGDITGGQGSSSGSIGTEGGLVKVTVNGNVKGGGGFESGAIGSTKTLTSVYITGNLEGGSGGRSGVVVSDTSIERVVIDGSVIGGFNTESGAIGASGPVGFVKIGQNLQGGGGSSSGSILSQTSIVKVEIGGSILGGSGESSGWRSGIIYSLGTIGTVDVAEDVAGGSGYESGSIRAENAIRKVSIHGSLIGGSSSYTGVISSAGVIGTVKIDQNLDGGDGYETSMTGAIEGTQIQNVIIGRDIIGREGYRSGVIVTTEPPSEESELRPSAQDARAAKAQALTPLLGKIEVLGSVKGGNGFESGSIMSAGQINSVEIGRVGEIIIPEGEGNFREIFLAPGSLEGGAGAYSGNISAKENIGSITIFGDLVGGQDIPWQERFAQENSGRIFAGGNINTLTIGRDLVGGDSHFGAYLPAFAEGGSPEAGQVYAYGRIGTVDIGNSILGGSGRNSSTIRANSIDSVTVGDDVVAGIGEYSASLIAEELDIKKIKIGGRITTYTGVFNGEGEEFPGFNAASIAAGRNLGKLDIGSIDGQEGAPVVITAAGKLGARNDSEALAIASIIVRNESSYADILAGYGTDFNRSAVNPDAQIGAVTVGNPRAGGEEQPVAWRYTNVVAGATAGQDGIFGTSDDLLIFNPDASTTVISKIASVVIRGIIDGETASGIVAEQVGSVIANGDKAPLTKGPRNDFYTYPSSQLTVHEPTGAPRPV